MKCGERLQLCVFTENVMLDSPGGYEEARPVTMLGKNIPGRRQADAKALRGGWVWCSGNSQGADHGGDEPENR